MKGATAASPDDWRRNPLNPKERASRTRAALAREAGTERIPAMWAERILIGGHSLPQILPNLDKPTSPRELGEA